MASLKQLGVECTYNPQKPEELHYSISIEPDKLKNPEQAKQYFKKIIDAVSKDAHRKDVLDHLTLSVNEEYKEGLQSVTHKLLYNATKQAEIRGDPSSYPTLSKVIIGGGVVIGGIAGLVFGYEQITKWAVNVAEHMDNASHLWAPVSGLIQLVAPVIGTAITTCVGTLVGGGSMWTVSLPYLIAETPLANRVMTYRSLEQALYQAKPNPKKAA